MVGREWKVVGLLVISLGFANPAPPAPATSGCSHSSNMASHSSCVRFGCCSRLPRGTADAQRRMNSEGDEDDNVAAEGEWGADSSLAFLQAPGAAPGYPLLRRQDNNVGLSYRVLSTKIPPNFCSALFTDVRSNSICASPSKSKTH